MAYASAAEFGRSPGLEKWLLSQNFHATREHADALVWKAQPGNNGILL